MNGGLDEGVGRFCRRSPGLGVGPVGPRTGEVEGEVEGVVFAVGAGDPIDAEDGVGAPDAAIAGYAVESGCSVILALNKWDALADKKTGTPAAFERRVRDQMKFLSWAPVVTISARLAGMSADIADRCTPSAAG
jgi:hypothetical protein